MADRIAKFASRDASNGIPAMVGYCESSICRSLRIISQYGSSCTSSAKLREECENWSDWSGQSWTDLRPAKENRSDEESGNEAQNRQVDNSSAHKIVAPSLNKILTSTSCWGMKVKQIRYFRRAWTSRKVQMISNDVLDEEARLRARFSSGRSLSLA